MSKLNIIPEAVPAILGGTGVKPMIKEGVIHYPLLLAEDLNILSSLNHSEITLLRNIMSAAVECLENDQDYMKELIQHLWLECNPEDTSTGSEAMFAELNQAKTTARKLKKTKKTIQNILFKLKKQQKNCY